MLSVLPTGVLVWPQGSRKLVCCSVKPSQDAELVRLSPGGRTGLWTSPANVGKRASTIRLEEPSHTHMHTDTGEPLAPVLEQTFSMSVCYIEVLITLESFSHAQHFRLREELCGVITHTRSQLYTYTLTCILTHTLSNLCECVCLSWQRSGVRTSRHVRIYQACVRLKPFLMFLSLKWQ